MWWMKTVICVHDVYSGKGRMNKTCILDRQPTMITSLNIWTAPHSWVQWRSCQKLRSVWEVRWSPHWTFEQLHTLEFSGEVARSCAVYERYDDHLIEHLNSSTLLGSSIRNSQFIATSYKGCTEWKAKFFIMCDNIWWGCRGNLKLITLGSKG